MSQGRPWRLCGVIVDVTEARRREESLQQRVNLQAAVLEQTPPLSLSSITIWSSAASTRPSPRSCAGRLRAWKDAAPSTW